MRVFAIADLHLPGGQEKPMDVFGGQWENHWLRIVSDWQERVEEQDLVLLPGDLSWAMTLENALPDLRSIAAMPGKKVILRGNHDYWWNGIGKLRAVLPASISALQNDAMRLGEVVVCGTRGWTCPSEDAPLDAEDEKIYLREVQRLELSLRKARELAGDTCPILAMLHYPPFNEKLEASGFTELLEAYGVSYALYGHLHGYGCRFAFSGLRASVRYRLVSCDSLDFRLFALPL